MTGNHTDQRHLGHRLEALLRDGVLIPFRTRSTGTDRRWNGGWRRRTRSSRPGSAFLFSRKSSAPPALQGGRSCHGAPAGRVAGPHLGPPRHVAMSILLLCATWPASPRGPFAPRPWTPESHALVVRDPVAQRAVRCRQATTRYRRARPGGRERGGLCREAAATWPVPTSGTARGSTARACRAGSDRAG